MPVTEKVKTFIHSNDLTAKGDRILLALSAGKDSMALVHLLNGLAPALSLTLGLFHLNHMVRGTEADLDEALVRDTGAALNLPVYIERHDFSSVKTGRSFEEEAREVRYKLLHRVAEKDGFTSIATAHNLDDNAETVLMRSFEGTGIRGLGGIPARRGMIIRPLLCLTIEEIRGYLQEQHISWREDSTNSENLYLRNYLRNRIFPVVKERFPRYRESLDGLSAIAREHLELLDELIDSSFEAPLRREDRSLVLHTRGLESNIRLFRYLIVRAIQQMPDVYAGKSIVEEILKKYYSEGSHRVLYESAFLEIKKTLRDREPVILFLPERTPVKCRSEWSRTVEISSHERLTLEIAEAGLSLEVFLAERELFLEKKGSREYIFVTIDTPDISFIIRNRRNGDRIRLSSGTKKIKEIFIEKKLDNELKNCVPLLLIEDNVSAVLSGFLIDTNNCIAESCMVTEKNRYILAIKRL